MSSSEAVLIYPHQLFSKHPALDKKRSVFLIEEPLFFTQYAFHKQKLIFHRASMKAFAASLTKKNFDVKYVEKTHLKGTSSITKVLRKAKISKVHFAELDDEWLEKRLLRALSKANIEHEAHASPGFLTDLTWSKTFFENKNSYFQTSFYIAQRKRLEILVDDNQPLGEQWTFDKENRKKLPAKQIPPSIPLLRQSKQRDEARAYVAEQFPDNPGDDNFIYPTTHRQASAWLDDFVDQRLVHFGDYQDAIVRDQSFLYHSLLSPLLNSGLLTPQQVISKALDAFDKQDIPLNSIEGLIRQVIGWREYVRALYHLEGATQRSKNYFGFTRKIPQSFWTATTGIIPVDDTITSVLENAYAHHIERLMILGNFMLLCEFDPDEVYRWFMELFIDSYDWVMVSNVYGMSQYADGGLMVTKPYVSSSNYICKMSNYKKDSSEGSWCQTWDGLYWRFISKHKKLFADNPRMKMMLSQLNKMDSKKLRQHKQTAEQFLSDLD